jgi:hypothetical protein
MAFALGNHLRNALAAVGLLTIAVHATPLTYWWAGWLSVPDAGGSAAVLLVPTCAVHPDGTIGLGAYWRTVYALNAFRVGRADQILLSGGGPGAPAIAEANIVRDFLIASGVPTSAIQVETASQSTRENALFSAPSPHASQAANSCSPATITCSAPSAPTGKPASNANHFRFPISANGRSSPGETAAKPFSISV